MLSLGMAWMPWIGVGTLTVLVSLLVFVRHARVLQPGRADTSGHRLGPGGEVPQFATGSPQPHAAKPPGQP